MKEKERKSQYIIRKHILCCVLVLFRLNRADGQLATA